MQFSQFLAFEQELPLSLGLVVKMRTVAVLIYLHIDDEQFPIVIELAETLRNRGLAFSYGFYFGSGKHDACNVGIQQLIIKARPFILYVYIFLHRAKIL